MSTMNYKEAKEIDKQSLEKYGAHTGCVAWFRHLIEHCKRFGSVAIPTGYLTHVI